MRRPTKKKCQIRHSKKRSIERYGVELSNKDLEQIVSIIQKGGGRFLMRDSNRVTIWAVPYLNREFKVAYDKERKTIATCLPMEFE